jgi:hypothetical protein
MKETIITNQITALNRVLLEKPIFPHTVNQFPACMKIECSYRIYNGLALVLILFNIILPSTLRPKWITLPQISPSKCCL